MQGKIRGASPLDYRYAYSLYLSVHSDNGVIIGLLNGQNVAKL